MVAFSTLNALILGFSSTALTSPTTAQRTDYVNWRNFRANGVNLGGWLCQEATIDSNWWGQHCNGTADEWNCCAKLGDKCASVFEHRYKTFITHDDIDKLASGGVNLIRIPTTYAAWIKVPGAQYYSGNQISYLRKIASYAIKKYGMHVVVDIHSLPGGINGLDIGERVGKWDWFNNQTNLDLSIKAVDAVLDFIQTSGSPQSYTLAPINEPADNPDFSKFGTPAALSDNGAAWVQKYINAVIARAKSVNPKIPVMFQGSFKGEPFWSAQFPASTNIVFDVHNYFFGRPSNSDNLTISLCAEAKTLAGDGKFPVFIGEWAIQTSANNKFANRAKNLNTGIYAYNKYTQGNAYWTAKFSGNTSVVGEGTQSDYWNYSGFIDMGLLDPSQGQEYCS